MDSGEAWTGQGYPPVSLLRLNQADGRGELESLLQPRCLQGLPLSASTVTVRAWLVTELWTVARWGPLSMGFSRQECWSGLPCPPSGQSSHPLPHTYPFLRKATPPGFSFQ